ncbi:MULTISPECIES: PTS glucitol/sorbitol transporter subunit IIA [Carnobacterium]|jgi:PTS system glucitol/sorbitol-specific IIA component|uniref:PTS glucose transporter subunit IIABC n=2 Tax=Carnobacterium inhibens TaxID=147709 RepID=U5SE58_9LACT|nr:MULTISPECIES: PTS glucitol/sorbitol transporter subunit IIA [Carnobacterium]AGY82112.1 PTS glucose transporter subunit IIABC [Carnobacterium inhibens subsp. gilichinskyi]MCM3511572.1 PTS glucitol/sorbitol transporter subunit IIA [Carnobacterium inhibens]
MDNMLVGTVTAIGENAISKKDPMIILFGEQATDDIRTVAIIQSFEEDKETTKLKPGSTISFGEKKYVIETVGSLANENLNTIGHVTLSFSEVPEDDRIESGVYLSPYELPEVSIGTKITYNN